MSIEDKAKELEIDYANVCADLGNATVLKESYDRLCKNLLYKANELQKQSAKLKETQGKMEKAADTTLEARA